MAKLLFTKALKDKWVKALKSGKYQHVQLTLKSSSNRHCCLGVLAEIHPRLSISDDGRCLLDGGDNPDSYEPFKMLFGDKTMKSLYRANDGLGVKTYDPAIEVIEELPTVR